MMTLKIHKAQKSYKEQAIPSATIIIDEKIADYATIEAADQQYKLDAAYLCDVLYDTLPGGTFDQLLVAMLDRKASHFKVSHKE